MTARVPVGLNRSQCVVFCVGLGRFGFKSAINFTWLLEVGHSLFHGVAVRIK